MQSPACYGLNIITGFHLANSTSSLLPTALWDVESDKVKDSFTHKVTLNIHLECGAGKGILVSKGFQSGRPSPEAGCLASFLIPGRVLANKG